MNDLMKFFSLSPKQKFLVIRIFYLLPYFKLKLRFIPFQRIIIKQHLTSQVDSGLSEKNKLYAFRVAIAIEKVSNVLRWPSACLEKAVTGKYLLKEENIPSTLYLGAAIDEQKTFKAHAWLSFDKYVIIGKANRDQYSEVAKFD